jgi:inorganic pyrophosphatase
MADLRFLLNEFDSKKNACRIIIETPRGSRNKFSYDPGSNLFMLGGCFPKG